MRRTSSDRARHEHSFGGFEPNPNVRAVAWFESVPDNIAITLAGRLAGVRRQPDQ